MSSSSSAESSTAAHSARQIIADHVVWEGSVGWTPECLPYSEGVLRRYRAAGFTHLSLTVAAEWNAPADTLRHIGRVRRQFLDHPSDYALVASVADIKAAHAAGKLAISFNFQGAGPFAGDPGLIEPYSQLGVKLAILCYNARNALGDGCQEPGDGGLSQLGRRFVAEMNRVGMMIDLSHVGRRTALEIIEESYQPCVFSHSNPKGRHKHVRNIGRRLIRACAEKGGVIGVNSLGFMLTPDARATAADFVAHIQFIVDEVGPEHVALGMDWNFYDPFMQKMFADNPVLAALGYPAPPWASLAPESLLEIVDALLAAGWREADLAAMLGGNMMRLAERIWR